MTLDPPVPASAPPRSEHEVGLSFYATDTPGIGGKLRVNPEDFRVVERGVRVAEAKGRGKYTLALVESRNWETHRLVRRIAARLGISERHIHFAGTKDKRAVTRQHLAIRAPEDAVQQLDLQDVRVLDTKRVDRAPKVGELRGNTFEIVVRDLAVDLDDALSRAGSVRDEIEGYGGFPNFFGMQRFGSQRTVTHLIGKAILDGRFDEAVHTYLGDMAPEAALRGLERGVVEHLDAHPDDHLGALMTLPPNLQSMFTYAYQSMLFNRLLCVRAGHELTWHTPHDGDLIHGADADRLPEPGTLIPVGAHNVATVQRAAAAGKAFVTGHVFGHASPMASGVPGELEAQVLAEAGMAPDDFRVPEAPRLSGRGTRRAMIAPVQDLDVAGGTDAHGPHVRLRFTLAKGSYATCLLREFMKVAHD